MAGILEDSRGSPSKREFTAEWTAKARGISDREAIPQRVAIAERKALDRVQVLIKSTLRICVPELTSKVARLDHQRISFPSSPSVSQPHLDSI